MAVILAVMAFISTLFIFLAVAGMRQESSPTRKRAARVLASPDFLGGEVAATGLAPEKKRFQVLSRIGRVFSGSLSEAVETELRRADLPLKGGEFLALLLLSSAGLAVLGFLTGPLHGAGLFVTGLIAPRVYLRLKVRQRLARFDQQIGDALVMMSNALKAGYSFLQAMDMVATEMSGPIAKEFAVCLKETSLGVNVEASLVAMAKRVGSEDFDLVTTAVLIQRQVGGNLSEILETIAETIRERVRIKGEIKTLTAQGRISGLIIGVLPLALAAFLIVSNPGYINLLVSHPLGIAMIAGAAVSEVLGAIIIRKIVQIEV